MRSQGQNGGGCVRCVYCVYCVCTLCEVRVLGVLELHSTLLYGVLCSPILNVSILAYARTSNLYPILYLLPCTRTFSNFLLHFLLQSSPHTHHTATTLCRTIPYYPILYYTIFLSHQPKT